MKKMKAFKMIGILMAAVMLVSSFTMVGYAEKESDTDILWEQKWEFDQDYNSDFNYTAIRVRFYHMLYMDVNLEAVYTATGDIYDFTFPEWEEFVEANEWNFEHKGYGDCIPIMFWMVRKFNISKEKFVEVNNRMKEDPYSVCTVLVEKHGFDKEKVADWFDDYYNKSRLKRSVYEDFMIEALYLEDSDEAINLLVPKGWFFLDGKETMLIGRTIDEIIAMGVDIDSNQFRYYIKYLQEKMRTEPDPDAYQNIKRWLKEIENDLNAPPAQTGDASVVSIIAVSISVLALGAVVYRRKRTI